MPTHRPPSQVRAHRRSTRPQPPSMPVGPPELTVDLLDADLVSSGMKKLVRALHGLVETRLARAEAKLLARVEDIVARRLDAFLEDLLAEILVSGMDPASIARALIDVRWTVISRRRSQESSPP